MNDFEYDATHPRPKDAAETWSEDAMQTVEKREIDGLIAGLFLEGRTLNAKITGVVSRRFGDQPNVDSYIGWCE